MALKLGTQKTHSHLRVGSRNRGLSSAVWKSGEASKVRQLNLTVLLPAVHVTVSYDCDMLYNFKVKNTSSSQFISSDSLMPNVSVT